MALNNDLDTDSDKHFSVNKKLIFLAHLGMVLVAIVWGMSFVSTKVLTENSMSPVEIYIYRFTLAYILIWGFSYKRLWARSLRDEILFIVLGLTGGSVYFIAENIAVTQTMVANVSMITSLSPLLTVFIIGFLYKNERPSHWMIVGSILAFTGIGFVVFGQGDQTIELHPVGDLLAFGAAVSFSIYSIVIKMVNANYDAMFITRKTFFYGVITALPLLLTETSHAPFSCILKTEIWSNLLFLGLLCSLIAYVILSFAIKHLGAVTASNYLYGQPIVTLFAGWIILGQTVGMSGWLGCALIIGGLWLGEALSRRDTLRRNSN